MITTSNENENENENEREVFEEKIFAQYFLSTIKRNPDSLISATDFVSDCKTKKEFLARNSNGRYKNDTVESAYWGWNARAKLK